MSTRFPKIPFGGSLSPKGPYPINARGYFESMEDALRAAKSAVPAGSGKGFYYIGQPLVVADLVHSQVYLCQITADRTLRVLGSGSSGDTADLERALAELTALVGDTSVSSQIEEALSGLKVADLSDAGTYVTHSEVVNNLDAGGTDVPLSAEMGKNLYGSVNSVFSLCDSGTVYNAAHLGGVNASKYALKSELDAHNHDDVYPQLGHNHDMTQVVGLNDRLGALEDSVEALGSGGTTITNYVPIVTGASTNGTAYTATVDEFELVTGRVIVFVPARVSASTSVTLNINSTGAKRIYQGTSHNSSTRVTPASSTWLAANYPVLLKYDGSYWRMVESRANASDLYGTLAITKGGTGATSAATARTNLEVYSKTEVDEAIATANPFSGLVPTENTNRVFEPGHWYYIELVLSGGSHYSLGVHYIKETVTTYIKYGNDYQLWICPNTNTYIYNSSLSSVSGATLLSAKLS